MENNHADRMDQGAEERRATENRDGKEHLGHHSHENHDEHDHNGHDDHCCCGHEHQDHDGDHEHDHHDHHHEHGPDCGCAPDYENGLSIAENNVLMALAERGFLPVAQFALTSSKQPDAFVIAMEPVYIADPDDSLDTIREYGSLFAGMEEKDLIELNYDMPVSGYPYAEYRESAAYRHFVETATEARQRGFDFDTPILELGGMSLTERGHEAVERMLQ